MAKSACWPQPLALDHYSMQSLQGHLPKATQHKGAQVCLQSLQGQPASMLLPEALLLPLDTPDMYKGLLHPEVSRALRVLPIGSICLCPLTPGSGQGTGEPGVGRRQDPALECVLCWHQIQNRSRVSHKSRLDVSRQSASSSLQSSPAEQPWLPGSSLTRRRKSGKNKIPTGAVRNLSAHAL